MPYAPVKRCGYPQCKDFVDHGIKYCKIHQHMTYKAADKLRGGTDSFYNSARWRKLRLLVLSEEPICRLCERNLSTLVDHILPRQQGGEDLARDNLQGLCNACHNLKTKQEAKK